MITLIQSWWHSVTEALALAVTPGPARDSVIAFTLASIALGLWRVLYWPALRGHVGRHR